MKSRCFFFFLIYGPLFPFIYAQEYAWEPQKHVTGYLTLEANYYHNLHFFQRDYAVSMSEAGLLIEYRPLRTMTFKGVFIYRPNWNLRDMVSEVSAEWSPSSYLKVKGGHLLTPLSPINTSFYAPVNLGVAMPMIVSHHDHYPTNMEALSVGGTFGNNFKINYCAFGGGYYASFLLRHGAMNFLGLEGSYFTAIDQDTTISVYADYINSGNLYYGVGGHIQFAYTDFAMIGVNMMNASEMFTQPTAIGILNLNFTKRAYGVNFQFKYNSARLVGEGWVTSIVDQSDGVERNNRKGVFIELSNNFGNIVPYVKYEFKQVKRIFHGVPPYTLKYERYIVGVNYKPFFETTFKLEYFTYQSFGLSGVLFAVVYSF